MKQKQKSVYVYTHTHTHTHTISFVYLLRTLCGRCLQWVSASWQGIRRAARSATGRIRETADRRRQLTLGSRQSGCFYLTSLAGQQSKSHLLHCFRMVDSQSRGARSLPRILVTIQLKSLREDLKCFWAHAENIRTTLRLRTTTSTARNCRRKAVA